ncbi:MAG: hypothetical protein Q9160_005737 [Pyrenula sp. 1 TL-2023]
MRRRRRGVVANVVLFSLALILILYLNRSHSSKKAFAWTTIRYKTTSAELPEARGICPGLSDSSKPVLVVARVAADEDQWLDSLKDLYHLCVYTADASIDKTSAHLQVPANRGHEAMAYLTFIIDNYEHVPKAGTVFVHGSRWAWHNDAPDYDNAALLAALNVSSALTPFGYHNLRCDWSTSMCSSSDAPPQGSIETSTRAMLEPYNARAVSDAALPRVLAVLFGGDASPSAGANGMQTLLGRTDAVRSQCCAQFVVARDGVWQHSREEYAALRQWLLDGSDRDRVGTPMQKFSGMRAPQDDRIAGRILSYVWHILFLGSHAQSMSPGVDLERLNLMACPRADECYCRLYGRCNLGGCANPGHCRGQYRLPPNLKLPADPAPRQA